MCGIVGVIHKNRERPVDEELLMRMRDTMLVRGPDDAGIYIDGHIGLAHRRLSIVGLSTGHQPMCDQDENYWITFNGEIYNYLEQKKRLEQLGYRFRTESDTEVIIQLYAEHGENCVDYLNGMFAFAIWDKRKQQVFLARDRLGIKPLYYMETPSSVIFASEIKALLEYPELQVGCNRDAVYEYFLFRSVSGEQTLFENVRSLAPGQQMVVQGGSCITRQYWQQQSRPTARNVSPAEASERLLELLEDAVRIRLMSEVPLGTFCSGGVDSSLVTAIAASEMGHSINTFSVGFHEAAYDETEFALMVSNQYRTNHHELRVSNQEFTELLPEMVRLNDEPLNFSNSVHIYAISKLAKEHVTVVLTGEGADELFFGYPRYQIPRLVRNLKKFSLLARPLIGLASTLTRDHRLRKLGYYFDNDLLDTIRLNAAENQPELLDGLLADNVEPKLDYRNQLLAELYEEAELLPLMSLQDQKTYLVSILNRQDKMSMGASVEARVPFIDYRLVEYANSLPSETRISGFTTKMLVKKAAEKYLPREVIYRRKSGFGVPLAEWFRDRNNLGRLTSEYIEAGGYDHFMNPERLRNIFKLHLEGQGDYSTLLWTALSFLIWKQQYGIQ